MSVGSLWVMPSGRVAKKLAPGNFAIRIPLYRLRKNSAEGHEVSEHDWQVKAFSSGCHKDNKVTGL